MRLRQRAAKHGEILAEHINNPPVHRAPADDHPIARNFRLRHAEIHRAVRDEHVIFLERAFIEQKLHPLAGGELAARVLRVDAGLASAETGLGAAGVEFGEVGVQGVCAPKFHIFLDVIRKVRMEEVSA
jgi:hypothetical protein